MTSSIHKKYAEVLHRSNSLLQSRLSFKQYQADGVAWCVQKEQTDHLAGAFIADEMGLGKTLLVIMTCLLHYKSSTLFVLPSSLLQQWAQQIKRFTGHEPLIFHGHAKKKINAATLLANPIVLTTYHSVAILKKNKHLPSSNLLHNVQWDRVVFDEAHYLRNINGVWLGANLLKSSFSWFITGTPIQNKYRDFKHICAIASIPTTDPPILRRTKHSIGLPLQDPVFHEITVQWKHPQEYHLATHFHQQLHDNDDALTTIVNMQLCKQTCILPSLAAKHLFQNQPPIQNQHSKLDTIVTTLRQRNSNGNGKLVFCQYKQEMNTLASLLRKQGLRVNLVDSHYTPKQKQTLLSGGCIPHNCSIKELPIDMTYEINSFLQTDVTILQIQSSCEGLNLQDQYSEVYFVGPAWNPSVEAQAIARCHRFGQTKQVNVFRFRMESFQQTDFTPIFDLLGQPLHILNMDEYILQKQLHKKQISTDFFQTIHH